MGWSTSAPTLPSGASWSGYIESDENHSNNYYWFQTLSRIARGANNTIYVHVRMQVYGHNAAYKNSYPYLEIPLKGQVSIGNTSSYSSSSQVQCSGDYAKWANWDLYYTGTAAKGTKVYVRTASGSSYSGVNTHTAPDYVTKFTITYKANGGSGTDQTQQKTYGSSVTLKSAGTFSRSGYTFTKWNTKADGTGTSYNAGATYTGNANLTLYAQWASSTYTVTYNANGGSGTTEAQTKTYGVALTLQQNGFTRTGYRFTGWNTAADGSGTAYAAGGTYTANAAVTLNAQWTLETYPVTYDGNGAESGSVEAQTKTWGAPLVLRSNAFVRRGFAFAGWNTAADGTGTDYAEGGTYLADEAATLYAQWTRTNIPVYVNADGQICQVDKAYANVGGVIVECDVYANVGGEIVELK